MPASMIGCLIPNCSVRGVLICCADAILFEGPRGTSGKWWDESKDERRGVGASAGPTAFAPHLLKVWG